MRRARNAVRNRCIRTVVEAYFLRGWLLSLTLVSAAHIGVSCAISRGVAGRLPWFSTTDPRVMAQILRCIRYTLLVSH